MRNRDHWWVGVLVTVAFGASACNSSDGSSSSTDVADASTTASTDAASSPPDTLPPVPPPETSPPAPDVTTTNSTTTSEPVVVAIDDVIPPAADGVEVTGLSVVEFAGTPLADVAVSPSADWIAVNRDSQVCLLDTAVGSLTADEGCVDFDGTVSPGSLAWSPDETTIAFHHDLFRLGGDPDIVALDVESRTISALTDDGTDDADVGTIDITPFFGDDGTVYFFRLGADPFTPTIIGLGESAAAVDGLAFEGIPRGVRREPIGGRIVVTSADPDLGNSIVTIDLAASTATRIEVAEPFGSVIALGGSRALIDQAGTPNVDGMRAAVVDLGGDAPPRPVPSAPADSDRAVTGLGLSPDGTRIVMIIEHRTDPSRHELVLAPILDDGSVGPLAVIARGDEFAPNGGDRTIRPRGLGARNEIAWTQDRIVYGLGPNEIVTLVIGP